MELLQGKYVYLLLEEHEDDHWEEGDNISEDELKMKVVVAMKFGLHQDMTK